MIPGQDWFIDQAGLRAEASPHPALRAAGHRPAKEPFTMSTQNTSTLKGEPGGS